MLPLYKGPQPICSKHINVSSFQTVHDFIKQEKIFLAEKLGTLMMDSSLIFNIINILKALERLQKHNMIWKNKKTLQIVKTISNKMFQKSAQLFDAMLHSKIY